MIIIIIVIVIITTVIIVLIIVDVVVVAWFLWERGRRCLSVLVEQPYYKVA